MKPDPEMHAALTDTVRGALATAAQEKLRQATADIQRLQSELSAVKAELEKECAENEALEQQAQSALIGEARAAEQATAAKASLVEANRTIEVERARCADLEKRINKMMDQPLPVVKGWNIDVMKDGADVTRRLVLSPVEG